MFLLRLSVFVGSCSSWRVGCLQEGIFIGGDFPKHWFKFVSKSTCGTHEQMHIGLILNCAFAWISPTHQEHSNKQPRKSWWCVVENCGTASEANAITHITNILSKLADWGCGLVGASWSACKAIARLITAWLHPYTKSKIVGKSAFCLRMHKMDKTV